MHSNILGGESGAGPIRSSSRSVVYLVRAGATRARSSNPRRGPDAKVAEHSFAVPCSKEYLGAYSTHEHRLLDGATSLPRPGCAPRQTLGRCAKSRALDFDEAVRRALRGEDPGATPPPTRGAADASIGREVKHGSDHRVEGLAGGGVTTEAAQARSEAKGSEGGKQRDGRRGSREAVGGVRGAGEKTPAGGGSRESARSSEGRRGSGEASGARSGIVEEAKNGEAQEKVTPIASPRNPRGSSPSPLWLQWLSWNASSAVDVDATRWTPDSSDWARRTAALDAATLAEDANTPYTNSPTPQSWKMAASTHHKERLGASRSRRDG